MVDLIISILWIIILSAAAIVVVCIALLLVKLLFCVFSRSNKPENETQK